MKSSKKNTGLVSNKKTKRKIVRKVTLKRRKNKNKGRIITGFRKYRNNRGIKI